MNAVAVAAREAPHELQDRIDALTALYERQAYLVYNVALVVCVAEDAALRAAERAFRDADEDALVRRVVHCALEEAPDRPALPLKPPALATVAQLGKVHRAALALGSLAELDEAGVAAVMGTRESAAHDLLASA